MDQPHESELLPLGPFLSDNPEDGVCMNVSMDVDMDMDMDDGSSVESVAHDRVFSPRVPAVAYSDGGMDGPDDGDSVAFNDVDDDAHSIRSNSSFHSLVSLTESVFRVDEEFGRCYHAYFTHDYFFPEDERHRGFMEAMYDAYIFSLGGRLHYSPPKAGPHRVLDLGSGTGSWALDYATAHPEAEVIGVDISPNQPIMVTENCSFEVDHLEQAWTWSEPFDFLYWRFLHGCFANVPAMVRKCYANLNPGGYLEMFDGLALRLGPSVPAGCALAQLVALATTAAARRGRPLDQAAHYPRILREAGFDDVVHAEVLWPVNGRTATQLADLGHYASHAFGMDLEGLFLKLLCRDGVLTYEATMALCEAARQELRAAPMDACWVFHMTYGRKPFNGGHVHGLAQSSF